MKQTKGGWSRGGASSPAVPRSVVTAGGSRRSRPSQLIPGVLQTMRWTVRAASSLAVVVGMLLWTQAALAKVAPERLADLVQTSDFIGIVRVDGVTGRIPLIRQRRASATILQSWKGSRTGVVAFIAQPTSTCDISEAKRGEEVVVFIQGERLALAGRGRMPIFMRDGRRYAAIWDDVILPASLFVTKGPDGEYEFVRGVLVEDLLAEVSKTLPEAAQLE